MKKFATVLLALTLSLTAFAAGCAQKPADTKDDEQGGAGVENTNNDDKTDDKATDDKTDADKTIVVGASSTPHAEILESIKDDLAAEGYTLEIKVFDDYVLPNTALDNGELDANYFQHEPYLIDFNKKNGTKIVVADYIHYEPFGVYGKNVDSLADLKEGATILVPADGSNETRALLLLQQEGLIKLEDGVTALDGLSLLDVVDDGGYSIKELQADMVPAQLENSDDGTIAVINGNYAIQAGLKIENALATEAADGDAAKTYANIIAVREGDENSEKTTALVKALKTDKVKKFIDEKYNGAVKAIF